MPELPEVETIAKQLNSLLPGKTIASVEVLREKSFSGGPTSLMLRGVKKVKRKQKIIVFELSDNLVMLVHLKMTGQLIYIRNAKCEICKDNEGDSPTTALAGLRLAGGHPTADWVGDLPSKHTRVILHFTDGSTLYFNDQRVFGWVKIVPSEQWLVLSREMAPDVVDAEFTVDYLTEVLKKSRRAVKLVILDQAKIGGMGNIYACDALYLAQINPITPSYQLKKTAVIKLHKAMKSVISKGIEMGGASISNYVNIEGIGGHYQEHFLVYDKEGDECPVCQSLIEKIPIGGRGTYYCPKCQA